MLTEDKPTPAQQPSAERPACPTCHDSARTSLLFALGGDAVHRCQSCQVEFLFPQPNDQMLASIYTSDYFLGGEGEVARERVAALKRATAKVYMDAIMPFLNVPTPRLLEIGCGSGDFLIEAKARGFEVEGIEYSAHAAEVANRRMEARVVQVGSADGCALSPNTYDVIAEFDVLEHVRNPAYSLECLYGALKAQGIVAIATPSLDSWSRRLLGRHWMEYKTEHLTYFSRNGLRRLLGDIGFRDVEFFPNYKVLSLDYICSHFNRHRVPLVSSVLNLITGVMPSHFCHKPFKIVASGMLAIARKGN